MDHLRSFYGSSRGFSKVGPNFLHVSVSSQHLPLISRALKLILHGLNGLCAIKFQLKIFNFLWSRALFFFFLCIFSLKIHRQLNTADLRLKTAYFWRRSSLKIQQTGTYWAHRWTVKKKIFWGGCLGKICCWLLDGSIAKSNLVTTASLFWRGCLGSKLLQGNFSHCLLKLMEGERCKGVWGRKGWKDCLLC